jgi:hypothetical protein
MITGELADEFPPTRRLQGYETIVFASLAFGDDFVREVQWMPDGQSGIFFAWWGFGGLGITAPKEKYFTEPRGRVRVHRVEILAVRWH